VQATVQQAIPYCFGSEPVSISRIAWLGLSFVPGLVGMIDSSKLASLLQSDYPIVR
jgi:hypothetical protein